MKTDRLTEGATAAHLVVMNITILMIMKLTVTLTSQYNCTITHNCNHR